MRFPTTPLDADRAENRPDWSAPAPLSRHEVALVLRGTLLAMLLLKDYET